MLELRNPDLNSDAVACWVVKDEIVVVEFAAASGVIASAVGDNHYAVGDALLTGYAGDRWSVSRDRFDAKYHALASGQAGKPGNYANNKVAILAKRMSLEFSVRRSVGGDLLHGLSGDWLMQYAPGDYGIVDSVRFDSVYRVVGPHSSTPQAT